MNNRTRWYYIMAGMIAAANAQANNDPYPDRAAYDAAVAQCSACDREQQRKCMDAAFERRPDSMRKEEAEAEQPSALDALLSSPTAEAVKDAADVLLDLQRGVPVGGNGVVKCQPSLSRVKCKY